MAAPTFYTQGDQDIYNSGIQFRPQQKYLLNDYTAPTAQLQPTPTSSGITNTNAFTNSGGSDFSVYNPDPNSIVNRKYDPYPARQAGEIYSKTFNPQPFKFESTPGGLEYAQGAYNMATKGIDQGFGNMRSDDGRTVFEMQKESDDLIQDARMQYATEGQYVDPYDPRYSSRTEAQKFMDNYPEFYNKPEPTGAQKLIGSLSNLMPGKGIAEFLGSYAPPNRRAIMENELSGKGIMVNDIGQIVQGGGAYDTSGNVMAGYNAPKMTAETFDKRLKRIDKTMKKPGYKGDLQIRRDAIEKAKADFLDAQGKTDLVFEDEEEKKKKKKDNNFLTKIFRRNKITQAAKNNQDNKTTDGEAKTNITGTGNNGGNKTSNKKVKGTEKTAKGGMGTASYGQSFHGKKDGGRIGYFFGGRVNFKNGGLASIL